MRTPSARGAFTILEIVIVLAITVLMLGMAMPAMNSMRTGEMLKAPARELEAMAITARCNALIEQKPYQILIDQSGFQLIGPGDVVIAKYALSKEISFDMARWPDEKWEKAQRHVWYFAPSGLCEPIRVMFSKGDSYFAQKYSAITGWDQEETFFIR